MKSQTHRSSAETQVSPEQAEQLKQLKAASIIELTLKQAIANERG